MAPLPANNTGRLKYTYSNAISEHTFIVRPKVGESLPDVDNFVQGLLAALAGVVAESTITAVDFSAVGTNIFTPFAGETSVGLVFGSGAASLDNNPVKINFIGRSSGGRRVTWGVFGYDSTTSAYRLTTAESAEVADVLDLLSGGSAPLAAIDGLTPTWKGYADIKANDYWVGQSRG